jgi:hypothetical protein
MEVVYPPEYLESIQSLIPLRLLLSVEERTDMKSRYGSVNALSETFSK